MPLDFQGISSRLQEFKNRRAEKQRQKQLRRIEAQQRAQQAQEIAIRQAQEAEEFADKQRYARFLHICEHWRAIYDESDFDLPIACRRGEEVIAIFQGGVALVESVPKKEIVGRSRGTSFRLAKGVTVRSSGSRGRVVHLPDEVKTVDIGGTLVISNKRIVYVGDTTTRGFQLNRLIALKSSEHNGLPALMLPVETRQRTSGVVVDSAETIEEVMMYAQVALAINDDEAEDLRSNIRSEALDEYSDFELFYAAEYGAWGE